MKRIWRDVKGYEGIYMVSNYGEVKSLDGFTIGKNGTKRKRFGKILKTYLRYGYYCVTLSKGGKITTYTVHSLVAKAFIENTDNKPCIDHIDGDRKNNFVWVNNDGSIDSEKSNLRWVTYKENANNPNTKYNMNMFKKGCTPWNKGKNRSDMIGESHPNSKPVVQYNLNGNLIKEWPCACEVQRELGFSQSSISACCRKAYGFKTAYGYIWKFKEDA